MRDAARHWIERVCVWESHSGREAEEQLAQGKKYETLPILFVELQHHVVSGNAEGASTLVVRLFAI